MTKERLEQLERQYGVKVNAANAALMGGYSLMEEHDEWGVCTPMQLGSELRLGTVNDLYPANMKGDPSSAAVFLRDLRSRAQEGGPLQKTIDNTDPGRLVEGVTGLTEGELCP